MPRATFPIALAALVAAPMSAVIGLSDAQDAHPAIFDVTRAGWDFSGPAAHAVLHVKPRDAVADPGVAFALASESGALALYVVVEAGGFLVTDGYESDGETLRPLVAASGSVGSEWHRFDVIAQGETFTLRLDGKTTVQARTLVPAAAFRLADPEAMPVGAAPSDGIQINRVRFFPASVNASTFAGADAWWTTTTLGTGEAHTQAAARGHQSQGQLETASGSLIAGARVPLDSALAYAHRAIDGASGAYLVEASVRPECVSALCPTGIPDHQAAIAGISGPLDDPHVHWAITVARVIDDTDRWALHLVGPRGASAQVSPAWSSLDPYWHTVIALVDPANETFSLQVDGTPTILSFALDGLAGVERLAMGDVWRDHPRWTGAGVSYHDDVAIVAWEAHA
jgi:hypothetical protein